jgi:hypothetical protein
MVAVVSVLRARVRLFDIVKRVLTYSLRLGAGRRVRAFALAFACACSFQDRMG